MTNPLNSLYTELVIEHDKRPQNAGLREPFDAEVHHVNPTCGDEITLRLHLDRDGEDLRIRDISYDAIGCAMSRASASITRGSAPRMIARSPTQNPMETSSVSTASGSTNPPQRSQRPTGICPSRPGRSRATRKKPMTIAKARPEAASIAHQRKAISPATRPPGASEDRGPPQAVSGNVASRNRPLRPAVRTRRHRGESR